MVSRSIVLLAVASAFALAGCDALEPEDFRENVVVESYQVALEPLQPVRISRTAPISSLYDARALAVRDAEVTVELLAEDGSVAASYPYERRPAPWAGVYEAATDDVVLPLRTYRLRVDIPGEEPITAQTLVPDTFRVLTTTADTLVYQGAEQFEVSISRSQYPGHQNVFVFTTEAVGPLRPDRLTPFLGAIFDEADDVELEDFRLGSSPLINEANYTVSADGSVAIALPWIAVSWYGALDVSVNAVDENMYDFIRSQGVQTGGSTLSPGEIPNVKYNVDGGIGVFGSVTTDTVTTFLIPPQSTKN